MITNLSDTNSVLCNWIAEIRDVNVQGDRMRFRKNMERIGEVAAYEISKYLPYVEKTVSTPMGESTINVLAQEPVLSTILRAGLPLQQGILNYFDKADCSFVAAYRKHHRDGTFEIEQHYVTSPNLENRVLIMADPMLATGSSAVLALETLTEEEKPAQIHVVSAIACTVGIEYLQRKFPDAYIWVGTIDEEITARGYIVPGLGDAGDLAFGIKIQS